MDGNRNEYYEYFERKPSKWDIIEFLEQCDLKPCLGYIARGEQKERKEKAEELLRRHSKAIHIFRDRRATKSVLKHRRPMLATHSVENKPDKQCVKDWEKKRKSRNSFAVAGNTSTTKATTEATTKRKREGFRGEKVQEQTKRVCFEEKSKKLSSEKRGDILPDGTKLKKVIPPKLIASNDDNSSQDVPNEIVETKESTSSEFDSIFGSDDLDMSKPSCCKA
ncbi:9956_t:CDS:2 [Cetraspora pellucida]|uniref:9956_t:CDS:1 n=1 Tax=Cetraspora pellucida TaxID=1433469 RepID=A0ACA9L8B6_9GLOM|nr:9956_t:CDS:2 [Cetraspora pellucida]